MSNFKNKNVVITGASRGIGLSIAKKLTKDGANIAILAKTDVPHSKLPGTIFTAAKEIEELGVKALPIKTDIRFDEQVEKAIEKIIHDFGSIDILVNNASAINLFNSETLPMKRYGHHQELANLAAYLVSDFSAYVNGEVMTIDGGEWVYNAGEFNKLRKVPKSAWSLLEKMTRKK